MKNQRLTAAGLAVLGFMLFAAPAVAGWWDGVADAQKVDLAELTENPRAFQGKEVSFECLFHEISTYYNPYYTRFTPAQYVNFSVWGAKQAIWQKDEFLNSHKFCFLEKDHKSLEVLLGLKRFTKLRIGGYVQNTFKNIPWIEVRYIEVVEEGMLSKDSLREIILADRASDARDYQVALSHYDAAAGMNLPSEVLSSVEVKRGMALRSLGRDAEAHAAFSRALELTPEDKDLRAMVSGTEAAPTADLPDLPKAPEAVKQGAVEARPVDPKRYPPVPAAMPAPPVKPVVEPAVEPVAPAPVEPAVVEAPPVKPAVPMPPVEPKAPAVPEKPAVAKPAPAPVAAPVRPAVEEEPEKLPNPEKRMSGPM